MKKNIILEKSFNYALSIIELSKALDKKNEYVLSKQLLRSGTSVGANIRESNNTRTRKDFIHKMNIAQKECDESLYWLELLHKSKIIQDEDFENVFKAGQEIHYIVKRIILTSQNRMNNP
jgi:four helix bundle protein